MLLCLTVYDDDDDYDDDNTDFCKAHNVSSHSFVLIRMELVTILLAQLWLVSLLSPSNHATISVLAKVFRTKDSHIGMCHLYFLQVQLYGCIL